jgi:hypothetical protein
MALFIVGGDFLALKIIGETARIKVFLSSLIKLSMEFGSLKYNFYSLAHFVPTPDLECALIFHKLNLKYI